METLQLLGLALGFATLAGINLYLTVFVTGLAIRMEWILLSSQYQALDILAHPAIITVAGVLYFIEFFADKVPWVDSVWDSIHTVLRPIGGTLLAIQVLGDSNAVYEVIVAILAGGLALTTHSIKAGSRVLVNSSPEPFSNIGLSLGEDAVVLGGLWLLWYNPLLAMAVFLLAMGLALWFAPKVARAVRVKLWLAWRKLTWPGGPARGAEENDPIPHDSDSLLHRLTLRDENVAWSAKCVVGRLKGAPNMVTGWLVATTGPVSRLHFVSARRLGDVAVTVDTAGCKVTQETRFMSENLVIYHPDKKAKALFLFDRSCTDRVAWLAAWLKNPPRATGVSLVQHNEPLDVLESEPEEEAAPSLTSAKREEESILSRF